MPGTQAPSIDEYLGKNVHVLAQTNQLRALHTIIRDRTARRDDFVFYSGRIIRMLIEACLDLLPFDTCEVETPVGRTYTDSGSRRRSAGCPLRAQARVWKRDCAPYADLFVSARY